MASCHPIAVGVKELRDHGRIELAARGALVPVARPWRALRSPFLTNRKAASLSNLTGRKGRIEAAEIVSRRSPAIAGAFELARREVGAVSSAVWMIRKPVSGIDTTVGPKTLVSSNINGDSSAAGANANGRSIPEHLPSSHPRLP